MRRREFIALLGGAAAWPLTASAQQKPVIGFLNSGSPDAYPDRVIAFHQELRQLGYIEGENVIVDYRWALGEYDRLPAFAAVTCQARRIRTGRDRRGAGRTGCQIGDLDDTDRLCDRRRPNQARLGRHI
jgi:hypothetical protein